MSIKVVAWNMNHWARKLAERASAWEYLTNVLSPDVALLQETAPPMADLRSHMIYHEIASRKWGTAVASFGASIAEITSAKSAYHKNEAKLLRTDPGALVATRIGSSSGLEITFVSMYGLFDHGYTVTTVHRLLSDLTPLIDSSNGKYLIVGGDINIGTQFSDKHLPRHENVLDRFKALGLIDCVDRMLPRNRGRLEGCTCVYGEACRHVRTQRHKRSPEV